jgi:hypothetical protein
MLEAHKQSQSFYLRPGSYLPDRHREAGFYRVKRSIQTGKKKYRLLFPGNRLLLFRCCFPGSAFLG